MNIEFQQLALNNPWWLDKSKVSDDPHLAAFDSSVVKWEPSLVESVDLSQDALITLRGPRQVGKTTALKLIVRRLLSHGVRPRLVFYFTCDLLHDERELVEVLLAFLDGGVRQPGERAILLLDEVSGLDRWQKAFKYLWDLGKLHDTTTIVTGSHSLDIKRGAELLPGRRGTGLTQDLLRFLQARSQRSLADPWKEQEVLLHGSLSGACLGLLVSSAK